MTNTVTSMSVPRKAIKVFAAITVLAFSALFMMPGPAQADLISTLTYTQPTGTVGPYDSVPVWLKFTLDSNSDPLYTDNNGTITSNSVLNGLDLIGGGITNSINGFPNPPYDFVWGPGPGPVQDWDSFSNQFHNLTLNAGDSFTYASTTFFPSGGGPVPAGTYTTSFYALSVWGPDTYIDPDTGNAQNYLHFIAEASNTFSRTVTGVPEPATMVLLGLGLIGLTGIGRKIKK